MYYALDFPLQSRLRKKNVIKAPKNELRRFTGLPIINVTFFLAHLSLHTSILLVQNLVLLLYCPIINTFSVYSNFTVLAVIASKVVDAPKSVVGAPNRAFIR